MRAKTHRLVAALHSGLLMLLVGKHTFSVSYIFHIEPLKASMCFFYNKNKPPFQVIKSVNKKLKYGW